MPEPLDLSQITLPGSNQSPPPEPTTNTPGENPFLQGVDEADREIVSKYISNWDANVTQRMQAVHEEYKPYKEIGLDPESLMNAANMWQLANSDPATFFQFVREAVEEMGIDIGGQQQTPVGNNLPEFEGVPQEFVAKYQDMEKQLSEVNKYIQEDRQAKESQANQAKLDNLLSELHNTHGAFDDDAVMARMLKGMKPEDAVADYKKVLNEAIGSQGRNPRPLPNNLTGNGNTPVEQLDASKMKDKRTRVNAVASLLQAANNA